MRTATKPKAKPRAWRRDTKFLEAISESAARHVKTVLDTFAASIRKSQDERGQASERVTAGLMERIDALETEVAELRRWRQDVTQP